MRRPGTIVLLLLLGQPAAAAAGTETAVSPSEFRAYAEGYTLYFEHRGRPAGAERFGADGGVTWRSPEGDCLEGQWREYEGMLCFYYESEDVESDTAVQCWQPLRDARGLKVRSLGDVSEEPDPAERTYRVTGRDRRPLLCVAPAAGT